VTATATVAATPATINLVVYHGDTWTQTFRFLTGDQPIDLAGYTFTASARGSTGYTTPLAVTILDPADGTIMLALPPEGLPPDLYRYDVQADQDETVGTWIRGYLRIQQDVTP
jgi:hypothetical protein